MPEPSFWNTNHSDNYKDFNIALPSERVAYAMTYHLANLKGKEVLDIGCFQGNSSNNILHFGARSVTGFDCNRSNIQKAKEIYSEERRLTFLHVGKENPLPSGKTYDVATMTFVHPVIRTNDELETLLKKTYDSLRNGGDMVIMGLNQKAFDDRYAFTHYDFNKKIHSPLRDEDLFENNLYLPNGTFLPLKDTYWSDDALHHHLEKARFGIAQSIDLAKASLQGDHALQFDTLKERMAEEYSLQWKDEWTAPLYKIIIAKKH